MIKQKKYKLLKNLLEYKVLLLLVFLSVILSSAAGFGIPLITQKLIDNYLTPQTWSYMIIWLFLTFFVLILLKVVGTYIIGYFGRLFQIKMEFSLRKMLFAHFQKLNVSYIDKSNEGKVFSRINEDPINIASALRFLPENLLSILIISVSSFTMAFIYDWIIGLVLLAIFFILTLFALIMKKKFSIAWLLVKNENEILNQSLANSIAGVKETKSYCSEQKEVDTINKRFAKLLTSWKANFRLYAKWMTWNVFILSMISFAILSIGAWRVMKGELAIGALIALNMYGVSIIEPINKTLAVVDIISTASASLHRLNEFMNEEEEGNSISKDIGDLNGEIVFKNVTLSYPGIKKPILKNISFKIKAGEKVAFIGKTGSGKSTILKALVRFYNVDDGKIFVDGKDITKFSIGSLRKQITYLQQDSYLFYDSIKYNVAYGLDLSNTKDIDEKIWNVLKIARADDFVKDLSENLNTSVGPKGVSLSGGQKQRISIARAVLKNAPITLFDEATSALDNETEREFKDQLKMVSNNGTTIHIAHRLTTIKDVGRIIVLSSGKIIEEGTPEALIKQKGVYYKLLKEGEK